MRQRICGNRCFQVDNDGIVVAAFFGSPVMYFSRSVGTSSLEIESAGSL